MATRWDQRRSDHSTISSALSVRTGEPDDVVARCY